MKIYNSYKEFLLLALVMIFGFMMLDPRRSDVTDDVFVAYKQKYDKIFGTESKSLPVHFGETPPNVLGMTIFYSKFNKVEIIINEPYWKRSDDVEHELLMFHELSHALLNEDHRDGNVIYQSEEIPRSIMNTYIIDESFYIKYPVYYIQEIKANVNDAK